jgi:hypothetical protein
MIIGITGTNVRRLGNGKTAYAVLLILRAHLKYQLPIYANLHLFETDYTFIEDAEDLFVINNGIVLIDDIQRALLLSKRNNVKTLSQLWSGASRKDDEYIVYTSSRLIDNVDKNLRAHTDIFCQPMYNQARGYMTIAHYDNEEQPTYSNLPNYCSPEQMKYVFDRYNTKEKVNIWRL